MSEEEIDMIYYVAENAPELWKSYGVEYLCRAYAAFKERTNKNDELSFVQWFHTAGRSIHEVRNNI